MILSAGLLARRGWVQRAGEVIHLIAEHLIDPPDPLRSVGERNEPFPVPHAQGTRQGTAAARTSERPTGSGASDGTSPSSINFG